jgi:ribonuclease BN (tRNA processing enzyme)
MLGVKGGPTIRPGSNMPTAFFLGLAGKNILVDAGLGVSRGLCDHGINLDQIDMIFITHLHSDHYLELGPLLHTAWTAGLTRTIPVVGPKGLDTYWTHFLASMSFDIELRIDDEGRVPLENLLRISEIGEGVIRDADGIIVTALKNNHPPIEETYALRFDSGDSRVVISGDTTYLDSMIPFAAGADLLVHEAMLEEGVHELCDRVPNYGERLRAHILGSHTSAQDVGRIGTEAGVKHLALNHFVPDGNPKYTEAVWEAAVRETYSGRLSVGRDGMVIPL